MEEPQPATEGPRPSQQGRRPPGQPRPRPPRPSGARPARPLGAPGGGRPARPARPPRPGGPARPAADAPEPRSAGDILGSVATSVQKIRAVRLYRASSATVRWIILVAVIGVGAALLIAFAVSLLVSLIPSASG